MTKDDYQSPPTPSSPEELLRAALDTVEDPFFVVDGGWRFVYANDRARGFFSRTTGRDLTPGKLEGACLWDEVPEAIGTPFYERYHGAMESGEPVTVEEYYEPFETWFEAQVHPCGTGLAVYLRNTTERHRQGEPIQERERVLREMYDVTADAERSFIEQVDALLGIGCEVLGTGFATLSRIRARITSSNEFERRTEAFSRARGRPCRRPTVSGRRPHGGP